MLRGSTSCSKSKLSLFTLLQHTNINSKVCVSAHVAVYVCGVCVCTSSGSGCVSGECIPEQQPGGAVSYRGDELNDGASLLLLLPTDRPSSSAHKLPQSSSQTTGRTDIQRNSQSTVMLLHIVSKVR